MIPIVTIFTDPPVEFYRNDAAIPFLTGLHERRLLGFDPVRRPVGGSTGSSENSNSSVLLDNSDGYLSRSWMFPPLRCRITLDMVQDGERRTVVDGSISTISLALATKVEFET